MRSATLDDAASSTPFCACILLASRPEDVILRDEGIYAVTYQAASNPITLTLFDPTILLSMAPSFVPQGPDCA
jgi:hypothetical protein